MLKKDTRVRKLLPLYTCADVDDGFANTDDVMLRCEKDILRTLDEAASEQKIRAIILDTNAPFAMAQIVHRVFNNHSV